MKTKKSIIKTATQKQNNIIVRSTKVTKPENKGLADKEISTHNFLTSRDDKESGKKPARISKGADEEG